MSAIPALDEEDMYLAAILDDPSGVELAELTWVDEEQPDACFRLWDYQWVWYRNEETFQIDWCFPGGSLVQTARGLVPIEQVLIGDLVLTHEGRWKPVLATHERGVRDLVTVHGNGHPGLRTTPDHELYTRMYRRRRKIELDSPEWTPVSRVRLGAEEHHKWATPATIEALPLPDIPARYAPGRSNDLRAEHLDNIHFWWLLGLYIAEGSTSSSHGRGGTINRVTFSVNAAEVPAVQGALDMLGFTHSLNLRGQCGEVVVNSLTLAQYLQTLGGKGAANKGIHPSAYGQPRKVMASLIEGMLFGDGNLRRQSWTYTTVSRRLAYDARQLAVLLGAQASVSVQERPAQATIQGRVVNQRPIYRVSICFHPGKSRSTINGDHSWSRITDIVDTEPERTYDLTVADDHSYVVEGIVAHNCGRAVGKSVGIQMRAFAFPFNHAGQEMLITAPELNHLRPVTDKVEHLFRSTRLGSAMLPQTRGQGINHQPQFQVHFVNNARIISRLPNRDGRGVKGMHPLVIEMDEGQDFPENGWTELIETMKAGTPGAQWRVHGVSRGVRDRYYKYTMGEDPDLPFKVHRYMAMHRPSWGAAERKAKIAIYGGTSDNVDYRRNIYGDHGDATNPVFVLARLLACVRINEDAWATEYNEDVYAQIKINDELLRSSGAPIEMFLQFPGAHLHERYHSFWAGMDVGFTRDPSEILMFGAMKHPKEKDVDLLRLLSRVHLMRISATNQAQAIRGIFDFYGDRLRCFAMDKTGNGLPLWQELDPEAVGTSVEHRRTPEHISRRIRGYNFSQKVAVEFDDRDLKGKETQLDAVIEKNVVSFATDELRKIVDLGRIELPYDRELLTEWQGQEIQYVRDEGSAAGLKTRFGKGSFHTLDAAKMAIAGKHLQAIEAALNATQTRSPVLARFG